MVLAIKSYESIALSDSESILNLAWTSDEAEWLEPQFSDVIAPVLASARQHLNEYPVTDPFGEGAIEPLIAARYGLPSDLFRVFCGAGVGGLIFSLAAALYRQRPRILSECYPDFPEWLDRFEARADISSDAVFLERPSFRANSEFDELSALAGLCATTNGPVIVDESNANYMPDEDSAVTLVPRSPRLVVLRGLSKGYCMGGLRFGYAICGGDIGAWVQDRLPPLQVNSISIAVARAILSASPNMMAPLRNRIAQTRKQVAKQLATIGLPTPTTTHAALPYVVFNPDRNDDHARAVQSLSHLGIQGKRHRLWAGEPLSLQRYSLPLNPARFARFAQLLGQHRPTP